MSMGSDRDSKGSSPRNLDPPWSCCFCTAHLKEDCKHYVVVKLFLLSLSFFFLFFLVDLFSCSLSQILAGFGVCLDLFVSWPHARIIKLTVSNIYSSLEEGARLKTWLIYCFPEGLDSNLNQENSHSLDFWSI